MHTLKENVTLGILNKSDVYWRRYNTLIDFFACMKNKAFEYPKILMYVLT